VAEKRRDGGKRKRKSERPLPSFAMVDAEPKALDPAFREMQFLLLLGEFVNRGRAHRDGKPWRIPFPPQRRSDSSPVRLAFVGWASGSADDDMIASVLYAEDDEYKLADDERRRQMLENVRDMRRRFEKWRDGVPLRAWMSRPAPRI